MLKETGDKVINCNGKQLFGGKFNPFKMKLKKFRTSLLTGVIFLGTNVYLPWDGNS